MQKILTKLEILDLIRKSDEAKGHRRGVAVSVSVPPQKT